MEVKFLQLSSGKKLAYRHKGEGGQAVIFVHGLACFSEIWQWNIDDLSHHFDCYALDLPGHGYSYRIEKDFSLTEWADVIAEFAASLGLSSFHLVGHSMGAQICIHLALSHPHLVRKLVLVAPAGFEVFNEFEKMQLTGFFSNPAPQATVENQMYFTLRNGFESHFGQRFKFLYDKFKQVYKLISLEQYNLVNSASVKAMLAQPVFNDLRHLKPECLIIFGAADKLIPNRFFHPVSTEQIALMGAEKIPGSHLHLIPQAGHFVQIEKAEEVTALMEEIFLKP